MNPRRAIRAAAVAVLGGLAATGYFWWRASAQREIVAAGIPYRPDLNALPAEMAQRVAACERRAHAGPNRIVALGELSRLYHANGFFPEAGQCYQGLLQVDAADPHWPYRLAIILAGYGQLDDALPLWRQAAKLAPDYVPARLRLGDTLLKTNRNVEAARVYAAVLERESRNPYALLGLARIDVDAGRWEAARERLEVVVQQSNFGIGYDLLPTVYEHLGEAARAEAIRARQKASGAFYDVPDPWIDD
jgi:tetratricopeptide (TPR) repeat protein